MAEEQEEALIELDSQAMDTYMALLEEEEALLKRFFVLLCVS